MSTDFNARACAYGLRHGEFDHLTDGDRGKLLRLMARLAEKSYRRGAQQGAVLGAEGVIAHDLHAWRYERSLDRCPWLDDPQHTETALDRLLIENDDLRRIGFDIKETTT